jgi:hypothetical protein
MSIEERESREERDYTRYSTVEDVQTPESRKRAQARCNKDHGPPGEKNKCCATQADQQPRFPQIAQRFFSAPCVLSVFMEEKGKRKSVAKFARRLRKDQGRTSWGIMSI